MAIKDVTSNADPTSTTGHTFWKEDFLLYPKFERTGHYEAGDVIYYEVNTNEFRFYHNHFYWINYLINFLVNNFSFYFFKKSS